MICPPKLLQDALPENISLQHLPGQILPWQQRRELLRDRLRIHPLTGISPDEVQAHFQSMPARYWEQVSESELVWGLETIHDFFKSLTAPDSIGSVPVVRWKAVPEQGFTKVMICTWDRHGLLAKVASAFSAVRINIIQADVYTRTDSLVLDVFRVRETEPIHVRDAARLSEMVFILDGALRQSPSFASYWACTRHKFLAQPVATPPHLCFDNESSPDCTILQVEAPDRLGLLADILQILADSGLNIAQAFIDTDEGLAQDLFHFTDVAGLKILDPAHLRFIRREILEVIGPCHD
jgi:[protein-PII] uridylyltransferase